MNAGASWPRACEHEGGGGNGILKVIKKYFASLPAWLGVFVTTRPETPILARLEKAKLNPEHLLADADFKGRVARRSPVNP